MVVSGAMSPRLRGPSVLLLAALMGVPSSAAAQSESDRAAAQALFDEAKQLRDKGDLAKACAKFAESLRLDPAVGTRFNLADCYERVGRLASAWTQFLEVESSTRLAGQTQRAAAAKERADALGPRLPKLRLTPAERVAGLTIQVDGTELREAAWGIDVPVDLGTHQLAARAEGRVPWHRTIEIRAERELRTVTVPALAVAPVTDKTAGEAPSPSPPARGADQGGDSGSAVGAAGVVIGAVGLAGLGVGVAFGAVAMSKKSKVDELCPDENDCTVEGIDTNDQARLFGNVSTVGFIAGGALLVTGLVMWLAAPSGEPEDGAPAPTMTGLSVVPWAGPDGAGALVGSRW